MRRDEYILTCDLGTTALKTTVFDAGGETVARSSLEYPVLQPRPLWAEQRASDWWETLCRGTGEVLERIGGPEKIIGIGLTSQRQTTLPLDGHGQPLGNAILWMDARSADEAEDMARVIGKERLHQTTGLKPGSSYTAAKILWLKRHMPELYGAAAKYVQPRDYLAWKLTGSLGQDYSMASRSLLFNLASFDWADELLEFVGIGREQLPELTASDVIIGGLTEGAAAETGLRRGTPVCCGGGDRSCEALGLGISGRKVVEATGTTSNISFALDSLPSPIDDRVLCSAHVVEGSWLVEQPLSGTGAVLRWFRDNIMPEAGEGEAGYAAIDEAVDQSPPGARGLLLLPFFMGARATRWNEEALGAFCGLTLAHDRRDMARAVMEGITFELRACLDVYADMGVAPESVVVSGGGGRSRAWNRIRADITGREIVVPQLVDSSSRGAALLAARALERTDFQEGLSGEGPTTLYTPDIRAHAFYEECYAVYNELYSSLTPVFRHIRSLPEPIWNRS